MVYCKITYFDETKCVAVHSMMLSISAKLTCQAKTKRMEDFSHLKSFVMKHDKNQKLNLVEWDADAKLICTTENLFSSLPVYIKCKIHITLIITFFCYNLKILFFC